MKNRNQPKGVFVTVCNANLTVPINGLIKKHYSRGVKHKIAATQFVLVFLLTACSSTTQIDTSTTEPILPNPTISKPAVDCEYLRNQVYRYQNSAKELQRMFAEELTLDWTRLMINNRKCFSNDEYCAAIAIHNSLEEWYRQESSTWCMG